MTKLQSSLDKSWGQRHILDGTVAPAIVSATRCSVWFIAALKTGVRGRDACSDRQQHRTYKQRYVESFHFRTVGLRQRVLDPQRRNAAANCLVGGGEAERSLKYIFRIESLACLEGFVIQHIGVKAGK